MFDSSEYPKSLDEEVFDQWLETGRSSKIGYEYMIIIWNELESQYQPVYTESRAAIQSYGLYGEVVSNELLVAAYDLYSEAKLNL